MAATPDQVLSQDERRRLGAKGFLDPVFFCHFFLPDIFPPGPEGECTMPWVHRGLLAILTGQTDFLSRYGELDKIYRNFVVREDPLKADSEVVGHLFYWKDDGNLGLHHNTFVLIMMPRGYAKTSIAGIAVPLYDICYQTTPFSLYASHAGPHAVMQLDNVRRELVSNGRVTSVFGDLRPKLRDDETWSKNFFETNTGFAAAARGKGGQVRGLNHRGLRPLRIRVDDLEDSESVKSDVQREATIRWAYSDLMPALPKMNPDAGIVALGTLLHRYDVLATWARDPKWTVVRFGVYDIDGDLLWPENMDETKIQAEKESYARAGQLSSFYLEYYNEYKAPGTQVFDVDSISVSPVEGELIQHAIYMDPAFSKARTADFSAIAVVAMNNHGRLWVRECWMKRGASQRELIDTYFALHSKYDCKRAGVENTAGQVALENTMREEMFRKKQYFELEGVPNKTRKVDRIQGILSPRYSSGYLHHERHFPQLLIQLEEFQPDDSHRHDDGPDAVAGAIALLDRYAAMAAGEDLSANAYEPLERVLGGDWRRH